MALDRPPSAADVAASLPDLGYLSTRYLEPHMSAREDVVEKYKRSSKCKS